MPRIDPLKLLTCLKVLLASNGGIRSENDVKRLAGLMAKYSKKLVSKCIYIQILKCTNTELLGEFMGAGGWRLTHMWLSDGILAMNWPLVQEILELLLLCPVDVERLRTNTAPKLVKGLCKDGGNEGVRILAVKLVEQWLKIVKGETMSITESGQTNNQILPNAESVASSSQMTSDNTKAMVINSVSNAVSGSTNSAVLLDTMPSSSMVADSAQEEDPLAIPNTLNCTDTIAEDRLSPSISNKAPVDTTLVYKIIVKDGKQVLAKIDNSSSSKKEGSISPHGKDDDFKLGTEDEKSHDKSNKENEKLKSKESESKDSSKEKDKSKSSKDRDRHRDHKSSSSHRSSSKSAKSNSSSSSKLKSHKSSSEKSREKDEAEKDSEKDREKHKSSRSSSISSSSSSTSSKDKHKERSSKDKEKSKDKERDKSKDKEKKDEKGEQVSEKSTLPSIDKLGKIPKKPKDDSTKSGPTSITIPSKKASMSIEIRRDSERPKTVKTYHSEFRSHGLTEEAPPPPSRKGLKKPTPQTVPGTSIPPTLFSNFSLKRSSSPPSTSNNSSSTSKESTGPPTEKKAKIDLPNTTVNDKPGAIKLIPPKAKPSTLVESDMFMDALSASAHPKKDARKRKRRPSASKDAAKEATAASPPESPVTSSKVTPLKFYQDTLEEKEDEKTESAEDKSSKSSSNTGDNENKKEDEDDIPLKRVKEEIEEKVRLEKEEEEKGRDLDEEDDNEEPVKRPPGPGCGPDGPPGVLMLHRRKGPKKKVSWRPQEELEAIKYFELDENERVNVTKTFTDMKQMERINEREAFLLARKLNCEDVMSEQTTWMPLILVDDVPPHPEGNQSKEKKIQAEREQTTLKALYFNRHMIPDSPSEPDMEQYQITEPAVIPLDDITGNPDAVNDFTSMPWPDPKGSPPQNTPDEFMRGDVQYTGPQFNPYMQFGQPGWPAMGPRGPPPGPGPTPIANGPPVAPNNMMHPPGMMNGPPPMGGGGPFNNMNMGPPNMMMGPNPDDIPPMLKNMNIMQSPFGMPGPTFGPLPTQPNNFNNFGPSPQQNMNINSNMSPPNMNGPRGNNNRGNWRPGSAGPPGNSGGNWRPQGPGSNNRNWVHGNNNRICKQFQRGYCRNGNKCNYLHPGSNKTF